MTDDEKRIEQMRSDIRKALGQCEEEAVRAELGHRATAIQDDLLFLSNLNLDQILALNTDAYLYFKGPNPHDDFYDAARPLLDLTLSVFTQLNGIIYFANKLGAN